MRKPTHHYNVDSLRRFGVIEGDVIQDAARVKAGRDELRRQGFCAHRLRSGLYIAVPCDEVEEVGS
mgnify:CR=1 FL=1